MLICLSLTFFYVLLIDLCVIRSSDAIYQLKTSREPCIFIQRQETFQRDARYSHNAYRICTCVLSAHYSWIGVLGTLVLCGYVKQGNLSCHMCVSGPCLMQVCDKQLQMQRHACERLKKITLMHTSPMRVLRDITACVSFAGEDSSTISD